MANPYYTIATSFIPGTKVRSDEVNTELQAIVAGFDNLPGDENSLVLGTAYLGTESGSGNTFTVTMPDTRTSYANGDRIGFFATHNNTGAAVINVDSIGNVSAVRPTGAALESGDIQTDTYYEFIYRAAGPEFQMVNISAGLLVSADARVDWAEEWAVKAEDSLVSTSAGGDGASDYSALHWAAKASASASSASTSESNASDSADAAAASAASINLPALGAGDVNKFLQVNATFDGYDLIDLFGTANTWTADQSISNNSPSINLFETDTTDTNWKMHNASGNFYVYPIDDSGSPLGNFPIRIAPGSKQLYMQNDYAVYDGAPLLVGYTLTSHNADFTLGLAQMFEHVYHTSGAGHTFTVPPNSTTAFPIATEIPITNVAGAASVVIAQGAGVTIISTGAGASVGSGNKTLAAGYNCRLRKYGSDAWFIEHSGGVT